MVASPSWVVVLALTVLASTCGHAAPARRGDHLLHSGAAHDGDTRHTVAPPGSLPQVGAAPGPVLSAYPSVLTDGGGESIEISWTTTDQFTPKDGDRILVSCGPRATIDDHLEKGGEIFVNATLGAPPFVRTPALINMRCNYTFLYIRGHSAHPGGTNEIAGRPGGHTVGHDDLATGAVGQRMTRRSVTPADGGIAVLATVVVQLAPGLASTPTQGHISFGDTDGDMWVMWVSASRAVPTVHFSTSPDGSTGVTEVRGTSGTYASADMCHAPANETNQQSFIDPGWIHSVLLTHLLPDTDYYFSFGGADGVSEQRQFRSRPVSATSETPPRNEVRFLAFGDQDWDTGPGGSPTTADNCLRDALESGYRDFVLHIGDIAYAEGTGTDWEQWSRQNEPLATRVPYMVSVGNHEFDYTSDTNHNDPSVTDGNYSVATQPFPGDDSGGECGVPVVNRFKTPSNGNGVFWYSFNYSPLVHVVMLSSEHRLDPGSPQHAWLVADLARIRGVGGQGGSAPGPWVVVTLHRMLYTTQLCEEGDEINALLLRRQLEPVLREYRVNLVLVGHQHSYERSCAVYDGMCVDNRAPSADTATQSGVSELPPQASIGYGPGAARGTVHVTVGTGGAGVEKCGFDPSQYGNLSLARANQWGYLRVAATTEALTLEFVANVDNSVWDTTALLPWPEAQ